MRRLLLALCAPAALALSGGCERGPEQTAAIEEHERQIGEAQHQVLLTQFGGSYEGPEAAYLKDVGQKLASVAGLDGQCTFTLVNTGVVNAFAVPGCYVYVTRGLMGLANSEAELAAILGHELGHVVRDHGEQQQRRSVLRQLGVLAVALASESETLTRIAGGAAELFTLRYSRKHEHEADDFAVRTLVASGYDPYAAADILQSLGRHEQLEQNSGGPDLYSMPEWGRTHPLAESRTERVREAAKNTGVAPDDLPEKEEVFLEQVEGLLYGDDPQQGLVIGPRFAHPKMRIAFEVPEGFKLTNTPDAVLIEGPDGLRGEFSGGRLVGGRLNQYVSQLVTQLFGAEPDMSAASRRLVNGVPAVVLPARMQTPKGTVDALVAAYTGPGEMAYHIVLVAPPGGSVPTGAAKMIASFNRLSQSQAARLRPRYIDVVEVREGDRLESFAAAMATERPLKQFLVLNGKTEREPLEAGKRVKVVRLGRAQV